MDIFGIGNAIKGMLNTYYSASRRTGRTTTMIESVNSGDRIIFATNAEARRVERLLKEWGKDVECRVMLPAGNDILNLGTGQGRTIFDHGWIEQFYLNSIDQAERDINFLKENLSGYGQKHIETKRQAIEAAKFR